MREKFICKLDKYEKIIQNINSTAQSVIQPETKTKLLEMQSSIKELYKRIKNNSFEIAIVGLEKAGKSTFANALIGLDILPTKEERCTYTSSCVKYADSTYAEVEFFSSQEFKERFNSNLRALGISLENYEYGKISLHELQRLTSDMLLSPEQRNVIEDITDMIKSEAEINMWLDKPVKRFSEFEMLESEFKNLVQNPDRIEGKYAAKPAFAVKGITVKSINNIILFGFRFFYQLNNDQNSSTLLSISSSFSGAYSLIVSRAVLIISSVLQSNSGFIPLLL